MASTETLKYVGITYRLGYYLGFLPRRIHEDEIEVNKRKRETTGKFSIRRLIVLILEFSAWLRSVIHPFPNYGMICIHFALIVTIILYDLIYKPPVTERIISFCAVMGLSAFLVLQIVVLTKGHQMIGLLESMKNLNRLAQGKWDF
jgi:hypothetical protein